MARWVQPENVLLASLLVLPYASYLAFIGLASFLGWSLFKRPRPIGNLLYRQGWLWLTVGLSINVLLSHAPGESALQSFNFIPFFAFYAALVVAIANFGTPIEILQRWALVLLLGSIPISLRSIVEFYFNAPSVKAQWEGNPWLDWLYLQYDYGHRADSVFGHPNILASYLVIILGLALGLGLYYFRHRRGAPAAPWVYGCVVLSLVGLFCSGSRNGLLVAGLQLLIVGWHMRHNRLVALGGIGAISALGVAGLNWGFGGRSLVEAFQSITLRFDVWRVAIDMLGDNPWWIGSGLGTFKLLYVPLSAADYPYLAHPHNLILMFATELGLPIAILFFTIVGMIVFRSIRALAAGSAAKPSQLVLAAYHLGFVGVMGFAMFDVSFYDARVNVLGWLMLAVIQNIPALVPAYQDPGTRAALPFAEQSKDPTPEQP
jgi:O-antigen ligase